MSLNVCYIPGQLPSGRTPLSRFLPPVMHGVASNWLRNNLPQGSWIIDPFGASPLPAIEAAQSGYRVLAAFNNPIGRFLLELHANPPSENELRAALADLGAIKIGSDRIEPHLRSLYITICAQCDREIEAQAFIWERGVKTPYGRIYECPFCGDSGERLTSQEDVERIEQFSSQRRTSQLHLARALERVTPLDDPDRGLVKEALEMYLPRSVYALFTLVNKIDTLYADQQKLARALLLYALDQCNILWSHPSARQRPRALTIPPRFQETNVWLAMEQAVQAWSNLSNHGNLQPVEVVTWPGNLTNQSGITIFEGRLRDLVDQLEQKAEHRIHPQGVVTAFPRPNQAYWTLSALWAGWLWGQNAVASYKSVLRRRRYDWAWYTTALYANCKNLIRILDKDTPFFGMISEVEPSYLTAALIAAEMTGFQFNGIAIREAEAQAQAVWQKGEIKAHTKSTLSDPAEISSMIQDAAVSYLYQRGEASSYLRLHTATISTLANKKALVSEYQLPPAEIFFQVGRSIQANLSTSPIFKRYGGSSRNIESGYWWLKTEKVSSEHSNEQDSLTDQIEKEVVRFLVKNTKCTVEQLDQTLCSHLCGLSTPEKAMILTCLESYGEQTSLDENEWLLKQQDTPIARKDDLLAIRSLLLSLGEKLGYQTELDRHTATEEEISPLNPLNWLDQNGTPVYQFYPLASAVFRKIIYSNRNHQGTQIPTKMIFVVPGSRAGLIRYKIDHDPHLAELIEGKWEFVKFRHLRRLAETARIRRDYFTDQLFLDPLANTDPQMSLL